MQKVLTNFSQLSSKACRVSASPVFKRDLPSIGSEKKSRGVWGSCQNTSRALEVFATETSLYKQYYFNFSS